MQRGFVWRFIAAAFSLPDDTSWPWLCDAQTHNLLRRAQEAAFPQAEAPLRALLGHLRVGRPLADAQEAHLAAFGHTVRGDCPPHEIEYGELRADPLFQPHRLADIAAFYSAFGLEVAGDARERVDHVAMECEFLAVLCAKEAAAATPEQTAVCRDAQKKFLREHLGRWTPAFSRRLERIAGDPLLQSLAALLRACATSDCARFGVPAGNEDLRLRPAEEPMEPCGSCGLAGAATGAAPQEA
jgi:TorA maturation chaperone TorD